MGAAILLVVLGSTVWVGIDASGRDWARAEGSTLVRSTAGWVIGALLLWIVFFPVYLAQRRRAPSKHAAPLPPPAPPALPPAGWYTDPAGHGSRRYWDGRSWTDATSS